LSEVYYRYHRENLKTLLSKKNKNSEKSNVFSWDGHTGEMADFLSERNSFEHNIGFCCSPMVNSYFSMLENLLVLLSIFQGWIKDKDSVMNYSKATLQDKRKELFDCTNKQENLLCQRIFSDKDSIYNKVRNDFSHGLTPEKMFLVPYEEIGFAFPYNPQSYLQSVHKNHLPNRAPITFEDAENIIKDFDNLDKLINNKFFYSMELIKLGVDPNVDFIELYKKINNEQSLAGYRVQIIEDDNLYY
jgi:hypothetical protein